MASKSKNAKNEKNDYYSQQVRRNQIIITVIAIIIILSMTLSLIHF